MQAFPQEVQEQLLGFCVPLWAAERREPALEGTWSKRPRWGRSLWVKVCLFSAAGFDAQNWPPLKKDESLLAMLLSGCTGAEESFRSSALEAFWSHEPGISFSIVMRDQAEAERLRGGVGATWELFLEKFMRNPQSVSCCLSPACL